LSQNVLAVCNFEMEFNYVLAGWEGSAHDSAVLRDAKIYQGFFTPPGKYWLGDAGYANTNTVLVPYCGTRYHLKEQRLASQKPENYKELFNLRHASLRNVIERIFGVVKRKYQILRTPSEYSIETQTRIILACCALHNYVRSIEGEQADMWLETESIEAIPSIQPSVLYPQGAISSKGMDKFRDEIAKNMWEDYQCYIARED
jgi:DDE superfamily endonuclease